jgi:hypothetical protein
MQEIACCPRAVLVVGNLTLLWEDLSSILDHSGTPDQFHRAFSHEMYDKGIWDAFSKVQVIEHQREALNLTVPINSTLLDVLSRFRDTYSKTSPIVIRKSCPQVIDGRYCCIRDKQDKTKP